MLFVGRQKGHLACKKWGDGGGEHWLVRMEQRPAGWSVCLRFVNLPLPHKVQKLSSGIGSPGWSQKKGCKTVVVCEFLCNCTYFKTGHETVRILHELGWSLGMSAMTLDESRHVTELLDEMNQQ